MGIRLPSAKKDTRSSLAGSQHSDSSEAMLEGGGVRRRDRGRGSGKSVLV